MSGRTSFDYADHPAPLVELPSKKTPKSTPVKFSRLEKSADIYNLLTEKEQRISASAAK